jgi:hypothetical protein
MGIAPRAEILDIPRMPPFGRNGANTATHLHYIREWKMDLSNHSYGFNRDGTYDNTNATRDQIVRGDATSAMRPVPSRLHVTSAGNGTFHFALTKQVKNALIVGNWSLLDKPEAGGSIHPSSSRGPTYDGRIKPDVVAPGTEVESTLVCRGAAAFCGAFTGPLCKDPFEEIERRNFYRWAVGSSGAAAVVTGTLALVIEQYRRAYHANGGRRMPLPSTLRGVMIHTAVDALLRQQKSAEDRVARGIPQPPNYTSGWGLIDAHAAVNVVKTKRLHEGTISRTCAWTTYSFDVPKTISSTTRVTLAWDDVAADPALGDEVPKLVNDLDLVVIDPNGKVHYSWRIDQTITDAQGTPLPDDEQECGRVKVQRQFKRANAKGLTPPPADRGRDHLNNLEVVDAPTVPGTWYVHVIGFSIAQGPQRFSLIGERFARVHESRDHGQRRER